MTEPRAPRYALVMRPAGIGTLPLGLRYSVEPRPVAGRPHHGLARHGILCPERELTADEMNSYEIGLLVDDPAELVDSAAAALSDYAEDLVDLVESEHEMVRGMIMDACRNALPVRYFSVADEDSLVESVIDRLGLRDDIPAEAA